MRLLNTESLTLRDFGGGLTPPYAILSHTWGPGDYATFEEMKKSTNPNRDATPAFHKIRMACQVARKHECAWIWMDTCCVDRTSSAELSETFNSNFRWFQEAKLCLAYLTDAKTPDDQQDMASVLVACRWFTRGWTLLELLAPKRLLFLDHEWKSIDWRDNVTGIVSRITGINSRYLGPVPATTASIDEKMSWTTHRMTSRVEDKVYCLLGLLEVDLPAKYGEGTKAFARLVEALMQKAGQEWSSLLTWKNWGPLHIAAGKGNLPLVKFLVSGGADPNSRDLYGRTSLHHAAEQGQLESVRILLEWGSKTDTQDPTGETALHLAARQGSNEVVYCLLSEGADASITTSSGQTAKQLASSPDIQQIFDAPPVVERIILRQVANRTAQAAPSGPTDEQRAICENESAYITFYSGDKRWPSRKISVFDLIYTDRLSTEIPPKDTFPESSTRWIHLPLNNITWVIHLVDRLYRTDQKGERHCSHVKEFVKRNFYERVSKRRESCFRQPHIKRGYSLPKSDDTKGCPIVSLVIPYFDMESKTSFGEYQTRRTQLLKGYPDLHLSPTLDQSYYLGLIDTHDRDSDQVLTKMMDLTLAENREDNQQDDQDESLPFELIHNDSGSTQVSAHQIINTSLKAFQAKPNRKSSDSTKRADQSRLLMVPQLWLWRVDERTIITSCPERLHSGDRSTNETLYKSLERGLNAMHEQPGKALESFIAFVAQDCMAFFNDPCNSGLDDPASLMFARYIALQSQKEVAFRKTFLDSLENRANKTPFATRLDIRQEIRCLREVKDVRDEINMIGNILQHQFEVFDQTISLLQRQMDMSTSGSLSPTRQDAEEALNQLSFDRTIRTLTQRWKRLDEDAEKVEKSLNHLLDLKQKQADLDEAASASEEAKIAAIQNQAVLAFTVVTVIFTPLSFVTSLYALDNFKAPTSADEAGSSGWNQNNIGAALGVAEGVTIAVLLGVMAYAMLTRSNFNPFKSQKEPQQSAYRSRDLTDSAEMLHLLENHQVGLQVGNYHFNMSMGR